MKSIASLATKPKLTQITLDDPAIVEAYGEPIEFYAYDIVSLATYFEFFQNRAESQYDSLTKMMRTLILLEDGTPAIKDDEDLPVDIAAAAITKLGEILGKSQSKTSTQNLGTQPE